MWVRICGCLDNLISVLNTEGRALLYKCKSDHVSPLIQSAKTFSLHL